MLARLTNWLKYDVLLRLFSPLHIESIKLILGVLRGRKKKEKKRVFVIGQNKTGTTSVAGLFRDRHSNHLTISSLSLYLDKKKWHTVLVRVAKRFDSLDDWPWNQFEFLQTLLSEFHSDSVFVLNTRDPEKWLEAVKRFRSHSKTNMPPHLSDEQFIKERLISRNEKIRNLFASHPECLVEVDIEDPDVVQILKKRTGWDLHEMHHLNKTPLRKDQP